MPNMSYCRFSNTTSDMEDCIEAIKESNWDIQEMIENASSHEEGMKIRRFIRLCEEVADMFSDQDI